ncbi:MAG: ABC transporter substrate-binding protein [Burkholderiaceae bacterium]|nr:ABC transporter substrate-binding protein [Burkholderiaceae bacterium]
MKSLFRNLCVAVPFLFAALGSARAAETPIVLGQSAALTGPAAMLGTEMARGMNAYFNEINQKGGVNGHPIKLITLDDGYEPDRTIKNTQKLIAEDKVVALVGYVGTPTSVAVLPMAKMAGLPFIGAYTGADNLRDSKFDNVFNIRASYNDEALRIAKEIDGMGLHTMGIVYQNDAFGQAGLRAMQAALQKHQEVKVLWTESVERNSINVEAAVAKIKSQHVDSVFVVSAYKTTGELLKKARGAGYFGFFTTLSFVGEEPLADEAGNAAQGVLVTAVMPSPHSEPIALSSEYHKALSKAVPTPAFTYASMEGYVVARVVVDALKKIKGDITPAAIDASLRGKRADLGGFEVDFTKSNNASTWVESTMIGAEGKIKR